MSKPYQGNKLCPKFHKLSLSFLKNRVKIKSLRKDSGSVCLVCLFVCNTNKFFYGEPNYCRVDACVPRCQFIINTKLRSKTAKSVTLRVKIIALNTNYRKKELSC